MPDDSHFQQYLELQRYLDWTAQDAARIPQIGPILEPVLQTLVDDFYSEIERHPNARKVVVGGEEQIERLKLTLIGWLKDLLSGQYDSAYVERRWKVGYRHVEIGLTQVYTNMALSRLRNGMIAMLFQYWDGEQEKLIQAIQSLNKLLDLDLAIIEDAYHSEYLARQQRAEKLATIGQVAGGVAHEMRNPLNVIKTSVYFLLNARNPSAEKINEHLCRIERQVTSADSVITALSDFAKLPIPNFHSFSFGECVQTTLENVELPANIAVELNFTETLPLLLADKDQISIVLSNLFRNAKDAMPDGGNLVIEARQDGDSMVELSVTDSGHGISEKNLSRIMEPLFTTKARGIGLGLSMARAIIEKNRGQIQVQSELGTKTTFTICLQAFQKES